MQLPVILIFDVGKTNKKILLFDKQYRLVYEESIQLTETKDEDGFPCEDVYALTAWIKESFHKVRQDKRFEVVAVNVSAYGASFVHLDDKMQPFLSLYNYLKPYDKELQQQFYKEYGGEDILTKETASPVLGHLNSGMQLYWLKHKKPELYAQVWRSLHLPQYISYVLCGCLYSDITSIGCHTNLWNFKNHHYHNWVYKEGIYDKLPPVITCTKVAGIFDTNIPVGCGLHDSSAALIPYITTFNKPFILLSTGTWNISINPFNYASLTNEELSKDCLSYLSFEGAPIKASRLFAGYEHEQQVKKIAGHFHTGINHYKTVKYDAILFNQLYQKQSFLTKENSTTTIAQLPFETRNLHDFKSYEEAYHQLIFDLIVQQKNSTELVMTVAPVKKLFVDGGFSKNEVFMNLLTIAFPNIEVYAATVAQASALGAAIAFQEVWNNEPLPLDLISVKHYKPNYDVVR